MRSSFKAGLVALMAGALLATPLSTAGASENDGLHVVGLVAGTKLVTFRTDDTTIRNSYDVSGLDGDSFLVGIDYRVQNGLLYGVGDGGGIYTIDDNGAATKIGNLTVALDGTYFGVDFNPAANALRVVSDTGQNLRQPFAMVPLVETAVDGPLTNPATPPATGTVPALGVSGSAYTNNDLDASTATTLFALDTANDRISIQSPANAGTLAATGNLGVDAGPDSGFDIYSTLRDGKTVAADAFATLAVDGGYALYSINLLTGSASGLGSIDGVSDIAIPLGQR